MSAGLTGSQWDSSSPQCTNTCQEKQPGSAAAGFVFKEPQMSLSLPLLSLEGPKARSGLPRTSPIPSAQAASPTASLSWQETGRARALPEERGTQGTTRPILPHPQGERGRPSSGKQLEERWPDPGTSPNHKAHHGDETG